MARTPARGRTRRSPHLTARRVAVAGLFASVALGAGSRVHPLGFHAWDKSAGDVAYAAVIGFLVVIVRPHASPRAVATIAIAVSFAVEAFQLTGIPSRAPRLVRIALGDTFAWHDLGCYVAGGLVAAAVVAIHARTTRGARSGGRA